MTEHQETTSDTVVRNVKALRQRRGWSAARLAEQCAATGYQALTVSVLSNIESGRRDETGRRRREVSVDELVALARALEVTPATLLNAGEHHVGAAAAHLRVGGRATGRAGTFFPVPPNTQSGEVHEVELTDSATATDSLAVEVVVPSEIRMDYGDRTVVYAYAESATVSVIAADATVIAADATVETSEEGDEDGR